MNCNEKGQFNLSWLQSGGVGGGAPLFQNMQSPEAVSELSEFVIHFRKHGHGKIEKDIIYDTRLTT